MGTEADTSRHLGDVSAIWQRACLGKAPQGFVGICQTEERGGWIQPLGFVSIPRYDKPRVNKSVAAYGSQRLERGI